MTEAGPPWPTDFDAAERVRHVAITRSSPRNAGWIAEQAGVSRDTAAKYLERMAERGELRVVETADGTCYQPDEITAFLREVRSLASNHAPAELSDELTAIADEIDSWKAEYGVDSVTELRQSVGNDELSYEERRARRDVAAEWTYSEQVREAIKQAIGLQRSVTTIDTHPGDDWSFRLDNEA